MTEKYRPANRTEGMLFMEAYCVQCIHDTYDEETRNPGCDLMARSMAHSLSDPEYPEEWVYDEQGEGKCTQFCP